MLEQRARGACKPQLHPRCARLQARAFAECASKHGVRLVDRQPDHAPSLTHCHLSRNCHVVRRRTFPRNDVAVTRFSEVTFRDP
jgi:hypothetical protein